MKPLGCCTLYLKKTHWEKTLPVCGVNVEILRMLLINGKKWHVKKNYTMHYAVFGRETEPMTECVYIIRGNLLDWFVQRELGIPILAVWMLESQRTQYLLSVEILVPLEPYTDAGGQGGYQESHCC